MEENKVLLVNVLVLAMEKSFYFLTEDSSLEKDDLIVVETTRGIELGKVIEEPIEREIKENEEYPHVLKKGEPEDLKAYQINKEKALETISFVQEESNKLSLDMKIISAEYMLDGTKIIIYYLSDNRVDFRELLKVLANELKCRIELRQIGTRDKAKMIGGIGICGLKLCCATFLNEFDGISITMAKNQMLALKIPKLSGHCGKLICCLKYENDAYTELQKDLPRIGSKVKYNDEIFKITSMNVITKIIRLENRDNILSVPYEEIKDCILPKDYVFAPNQQFKHQHNPRPIKKEEKKDAKN